MAHVEHISVLADDYISGLEVRIRVNNRQLETRNVGCKRARLGSAEPRYYDTLVLDPYEHIDYISCRYAKGGVYMLTLRTNQG